MISLPTGLITLPWRGIAWLSLGMSLVAIGAYGYYDANTQRARASQIEADFAKYREHVALAAERASEQARQDDFNRQEALNEVARVQATARSKQLASERSDALAGAAGVRSLHDTVATERGAAHANPGTAADCQARADAYADVFLACSAEHQRMGDAATEALGTAISRGIGCEQRYEAVRDQPTGLVARP